MRWPTFGSARSADSAPASLAQERIWKLCTSPAAGAGYTVGSAQLVRGPLEVETLKLSIEYLIARHEALRTTFEEREGMLYQSVHPPAPIEIGLFDASTAADPPAQADLLLRELAAPPFDVAGGPHLRLQVVKLGEQEYSLQRAHHHIISDGGSWVLFGEELAVVYEALCAGEEVPLGAPPPLSSGDLAAAERARIRPGSRRRRRLLARWAKLAEVEATAPPFERAKPISGVAATEGTISWVLAPEASETLQRLASLTESTYYTIRLAIFVGLLAVEAEVEETLLGTYVTTRRQPETRRMFGCFTHLAPLRLPAPAKMTLGSWIATVRRAVTDVKDVAAELPYEAVAEELSAKGVALPGIRVLFSLYERAPALHFSGIEVGAAQPLLDRCMPSGFSFVVNRTPDGEHCRVDFDANVYDPALVGAFIGRYQRLVDQLRDASESSVLEPILRSVASASAPAEDGALR